MTNFFLQMKFKTFMKSIDNEYQIWSLIDDDVNYLANQLKIFN